MIERVLPPGVRFAERYDDVPESEHPLLGAEPVAVVRAVESRRWEFVTGRVCAREALAALGVGPVAVPVGADRAPVWPDGVVGSLTHCEGYRAAAVAWDHHVAGLGVDAEPAEPLPPDVLGVVALPNEAAMLGELADRDRDIAWDRLLFSAKESVFKAWHPLTGRWLDFAEAVVTLRPDRTFTTQLLVPGLVVDKRPREWLAGRWYVDGPLLVTAVVVEKAHSIGGS